MIQYALRLDARLMALPRWTRVLVIAITVAVMMATSLEHVPQPYVDFSHVPLLSHIEQRDTYGTDTISDTYGAKVVLNNVLDMYSRADLEQTPLEAATWSKEATAPYPPAVLLSSAALYAIGEWTGAGYYGMILLLVALFLALSIRYFFQTRWYLFPLLYLNFSYFALRFVYVQDGTYVIMLVVIIVALTMARRGVTACHALMALAITMKLSPMYYATHVLRMPRSQAVLFGAILLLGLVAPYFIWENYLYIYRFGLELKGSHWYETAGAIAIVAPFTVALRYVETRFPFDLEDRIGWSVVPLSLFFAVKMNTARHLLIVLLIPDKRGARNIAAAVGLGCHALLPSVIKLGSTVYISTAVLIVALACYMRQIGWDVVRDDFRHPGRTLRLMFSRSRNAAGAQA